jgi:hypothetical protein
MRQLRFYEKNPTVKQAITLLLKFPPDIKAILAKGFCALAEGEFNAHEMLQDLKSLGPEKVLALYQSKFKRREYDCDPNLTKAMNYLMVLTPEDQFFLALKLLELINVVREFMVLCKKHAISIQLAFIERITGIYVRYGLNEAEDFIVNTRHTFERLLLQSAKILECRPLQNVGNAIDELLSNERSGMRIRQGL